LPKLKVTIRAWRQVIRLHSKPIILMGLVCLIIFCGSFMFVVSNFHRGAVKTVSLHWPTLPQPNHSTKPQMPSVLVQPDKSTLPKPAEPIKQPSCAERACVALTFDDGPAAATEPLLNHLATRHVHATFFVLGMYVERQAPIMRRMVSEGHQVGNHTWDHYRLRDFSPAVITSEVQRTNDIVQQVTGVRPTIMRPPYGETNLTIMSISGLPQILWSIDTEDWRDRNSGVIAQRVINSASSGAIILLHDIYPTSVDAVPAIIDGLRAKGLEPVTIDELLDKPTEVREYRHR